MGIITLDDPSATALSQARSINSLGQIVGFYRDAGGDHGFLFSGGQFTTIDDPSGANATDAQGTNERRPDRRILPGQRLIKSRFGPVCRLKSDIF